MPPNWWLYASSCSLMAAGMSVVSRESGNVTSVRLYDGITFVTNRSTSGIRFNRSSKNRVSASTRSISSPRGMRTWMSM